MQNNSPAFYAVRSTQGGMRMSELPRYVLENYTRMGYWWPLIKSVNVPKPVTKIIPLVKEAVMAFIYPYEANPKEKEALRKILAVVRSEAKKFGFPLFIRTDLVSGKHDWENSCFVASENNLTRCIRGLAEANSLAEVIPEAIILREYIPLESAFTAFFGNMPVSKERRYFVANGRVQCHHPYWPEDSIRFLPGNEPNGWQEKLADLNRETEEEIALLSDYANRLASILIDYWSLDFAKGENGVWYFIDAARGELSWHPHCQALKKGSNTSLI